MGVLCISPLLDQYVRQTHIAPYSRRVAFLTIRWLKQTFGAICSTFQISGSTLLAKALHAISIRRHFEILMETEKISITHANQPEMENLKIWSKVNLGAVPECIT